MKPWEFFLLMGLVCAALVLAIWLLLQGDNDKKG